MDDDLEAFSRDQLVAEVKRLRTAIREHRDSSLHELCWHHPKCGDSCPKSPIRSPSFPSGRSFCAGVFVIANLWTSSCHMHAE